MKCLVSIHVLLFFKIFMLLSGSSPKLSELSVEVELKAVWTVLTGGCECLCRLFSECYSPELGRHLKLQVL